VCGSVLSNVTVPVHHLRKLCAWKSPLLTVSALAVCVAIGIRNRSPRTIKGKALILVGRWCIVFNPNAPGFGGVEDRTRVTHSLRFLETVVRLPACLASWDLSCPRLHYPAAAQSSSCPFIFSAPVLVFAPFLPLCIGYHFDRLPKTRGYRELYLLKGSKKLENMTGGIVGKVHLLNQRAFAIRGHGSWLRRPAEVWGIVGHAISPLAVESHDSQSFTSQLRSPP